jgi:hypothetical protein
MAQQSQFGLNSLGRPERILACHPPDEVDYSPRDRGSASSPGAGLPFPEEFEGLAMPAHDCLGLYQDEAGPPVPPYLRQGNPEKPVALAKSGALHASSEHHELMSKG